jgi:hypothetical protein
LLLVSLVWTVMAQVQMRIRGMAIDAEHRTELVHRTRIAKSKIDDDAFLIDLDDTGAINRLRL